MVNRTLDDDTLNSFVDPRVRRLASFDSEALAAAKTQIFGSGRRQLPRAMRSAIANLDRGREIGRLALEKRTHITDLAAEHRNDLETKVGIVPQAFDQRTT
jgi:hypothetical protein